MSSTYSDKQMREIFHFLFLEQLLKISSSGTFILKGGVNLRFFLKSPRYSEDMDIDVIGSSVATLKKNGYKILEDAAFKRQLAFYGIRDLLVNDKEKAKHTETTQRFRLRLVNQAGEEFPTEVEFSRRESLEQYESETVDPEIAGLYKKLAFSCEHYPGPSAARQKISALAYRTEVQARDVFDLYLLYLGGHCKDSVSKVTKEERSQAQESALSVTYDLYRDHVESYLNQEGLNSYGGKKNWNSIQEKVIEVLS